MLTPQNRFLSTMLILCQMFLGASFFNKPFLNAIFRVALNLCFVFGCCQKRKKHHVVRKEKPSLCVAFLKPASVIIIF